MKRKWVFAVLVGVMAMGQGVPMSFGQDSGGEHRSGALRRREVQGNGGNEIATVVPYMVIMAVFLGLGVYSFVVNRPSTPKGR